MLLLPISALVPAAVCAACSCTAVALLSFHLQLLANARLAFLKAE